MKFFVLPFPSLVLLVLLLLLLPLSLTFVESSTLLSSSSIELCTRTSSNQSFYEPANCNKKLVVTLAVDGSNLYDSGAATSSVLVWQTAEDKSTGQTLTAAEPIRITVKKSEPVHRYALNYIRNFNSKPFETNIYTPLIPGCDESSTCGTAYDESGSPIQYSGGFCCSCSACQLFGFCSNDDRANTRCSLFGDVAVASCLSFSDVWYSAYSIGQAETSYNIEIEIEIPISSSSSSSSSSSNNNTSTNEKKTHKLILGPDRLVGVDPDRIAAARLVGDFAPFKAPISLESDLLFVPASPASHPRVQNGEREWLLIPRDMTDDSGLTCNKIGISFAGFYQQGARCDAMVGSCLKNQLEDLRAADLERLSKNLSPRYLASKKANFKKIDVSSSSSSSSPSTSPYLAYTVQGVQSSVVTLQINADKLALSVNVAPGRILFVNVTKINFASNSRDGEVEILIMNTGDIAAKFFVSIHSCQNQKNNNNNNNVIPILSKIIEVTARQVEQLFFPVSVSCSNGCDIMCNVTLQNSLYETVDSRKLIFQVNATKITRGAQNGNNGAQGDSVNGPSSSDNDGDCDDCFILNLLCVVSNCSLGQNFLSFGTLIGSLILLFVIFKAVQFLKRYCCRGGNNNNDDDDNDEEEEKQKERNRKRNKQKKNNNNKKKQEEEEEEEEQEEMKRSKIRQVIEIEPRIISSVFPTSSSSDQEDEEE